VPHFDREEVIIVLLSLPVRGVLSEKRFNLPPRSYGANGATESRTNMRPRLSSWTERLAHDRIVARVDHLVPEISDELNRIAYSRVVEGGN